MMLLWKEWTRLRGRMMGLTWFYFLTAFLVPLPRIEGPLSIFQLPILLCGWGAAMLLIPAIMGMDAYAGERDEGTEVFYFSKPISFGRILLAKFGTRFMATLLAGALVMAVVLFRLDATGAELHLATPPFVIWSVVGIVVVAQLLVLAVTMTVSVRAPYQSTALIVGGALGGVLAAIPVIPSLWRTAVLQDLWGVFWLLLLGSVIVFAIGSRLVGTRQIYGGGA